MRRYRVSLKRTQYAEIEVEADNPYTAEHVALEEVDNKDFGRTDPTEEVLTVDELDPPAPSECLTPEERNAGGTI